MAKRKHGRQTTKRRAGKSRARRNAAAPPAKTPRQGVALEEVDTEGEPNLGKSAEPGKIERSTSQKAAEQPEDLDEPDWEK